MCTNILAIWWAVSGMRHAARGGRGHVLTAKVPAGVARTHETSQKTHTNTPFFGLHNGNKGATAIKNNGCNNNHNNNNNRPKLLRLRSVC